MAISTSKQEIYAEGATDISWTRLQSNPLLQGANNLTNIRFGQYKRNPDAENPLVPDADENANIATEESGNLRVGAFRGAIKRHDVTFDNASDYENVEFNRYFGENLVKNVPKNLNVDGIIYSHDVNEPAAKIEANDSVRNLTVGIGTSGAIYGAGAAATTATQGIAGGTALYVSSGTNSRNFTLDLETVGAKLYGGGGGGVTGGTGPSQTITCRRVDQRPDPDTNRVGTTTSIVDTSYTTTRGAPSGTTTYGPFYEHTAGSISVPGFPPNLDYARDWNLRVEADCERRYGSSANSGNGGGAPSNFDGVERSNPVFFFYQHSPTNGLPANYRTNWPPGPDYVLGVLQYDCFVPAYRADPVYVNQQTVRTTYRYRNENTDVTGAGGAGGPGGKGQGYQRAFTQGAAGSDAVQVTCETELGLYYNANSTTLPRTGKNGTSGGDWGEPGGTSTDENGVPEYIGGLAGYAVQVANSDIAIEILGNDDPNDPNNPLKGRNNVE